MDDLIRRYVSIEYVCAMMMRKGFRSKEMTISEFMDILKPSDVVSREAYEKLKSAQPEIIRCKDCKHYEIWQLKSDYTDDKRYKPSVCVRGQYAVHHSPDWFCADAERREDG